MVEQDIVEGRAVRRDARERTVRSADRTVVGVEQRKPMVAMVERIKECNIARRVRRRVVEAQRRALQDRLCRYELAVRGNRSVQVPGGVQDVVDDEKSEVLVRGSALHDGVVWLVQDVRLLVTADGPCDDLGLAAFEMHGERVVVQSPSEGDVGVARREVREAAREDVVRESVSESRRVGREIA